MKKIKVTSYGFIYPLATMGPTDEMFVTDEHIKWLKDSGFTYEVLNKAKKEKTVVVVKKYITPSYGELYINVNDNTVTAKIDKPSHEVVGDADVSNISSELVISQGDKVIKVLPMKEGVEVSYDITKAGKYNAHILTTAIDERVEKESVAHVMKTKTLTIAKQDK